MSDHLYLEIKVGDIVHNPDKPHTGIFDGMLIEYIYTPDWNVSEFKFSNHTLKTFAIVEVPVSWLPYVKEMCKYNGNCDDMENDLTFRNRKVVILLDDIETKAGSSGLVTKLRGSDIVPVIDLRHLNDPAELIKDSKYIDFDKYQPKLDHNSIASGSYTVGPSGADYLTFVALINDISGQSGDIDGQLIGDITETSQATYSGVASYQLLFHSDTPHAGINGNGHTVTINQNSWQYRIQSNGEIEAKDFSALRIQDTPGDGRYAIFSNIGGNCTLKIHDMYMRGDTAITTLGAAVRGQATGCEIYIWNCVIWYFGLGVYIDNAIDSASLVTNVTALENHWSMYANSKALTFRSVGAYEPGGGGGCWGLVGSADGYNNACSDTTGEDADFSTGSGNKDSLTTSNEIEESVSSENLGVPLSGSQVNAGGSTTHQSATDMRGVTWGDNPSIGAFQSVYGGTLPQRKCKLTIQGSKVSGSPSDLIIKLNKDNLPEEMYDADSGNAAQNGGGDLRLATDEAGINFIPLHIRAFVTDNNPANSIVDMAIKEDAAGGNQDLWIFYKTVASDSQPPTDAPGGSKGVYDFCFGAFPLDDSSGDILDYSPNGIDGDANGNIPDQRTDSDFSKYYQDFDGTGDYVSWGTNKLSSSSEDVVVFSGMFRFDNGEDNPIIASGAYAVDGDFTIWVDTDIDNEIHLSVNGNDPLEVESSGANIQASTWYHLVIRYRRTGASSGTVEFYVDGVSKGTTTSWTDIVPLRLDRDVYLMNDDIGTETDGQVDEFLVVDANKGDNYWATYYESWKNPSTFIIEGTPQNVEPAGVTPYYFERLLTGN
jgi:hypothetical protein